MRKQRGLTRRRVIESLLIPLAAKSQPILERGCAVLIGVDRYAESANFSDLNFSESDTEVLAAEFVRKNFRVFACQNTDATLRTVIRGLTQLLDVYRDRPFIFVFSGHGLQQQHTSYLVLEDSIAKSPESTALAVTTLYGLVTKYRVRKACFILNACRNVLADEASDSSSFYPDPPGNALFAFGTQAGGFAFEDKARLGTVFLGACIDSVRVSLQQSIRTQVKASAFLSGAAKLASERARQLGKGQRVELWGLAGADFVLFEVEEVDVARREAEKWLSLVEAGRLEEAYINHLHPASKATLPIEAFAGKYSQTVNAGTPERRDLIESLEIKGQPADPANPFTPSHALPSLSQPGHFWVFVFRVVRRGAGEIERVFLRQGDGETWWVADMWYGF